MSASHNHWTGIGNLTSDPELKYTKSGTARTRFSLAINRKWKNKTTGELEEEVVFVPVITWGSQAEHCSKYLTKGRSAFVEGRLRIDSFENENGEKKKIVEIVASNVQFLGGNPGAQQSDTAEPAQKAAKPAEDGRTTEEVPF